MLLDGESGGPYHAWQLTTPALKKELEETGLFQVDVVTAPGPVGDFSAFRPDFSTYRVIVMNYDAPDERQGDELYSSLRGPGENMTVLATAYSDRANHGTGHEEPILLTLKFGKGRVFHTTLGHDVNALSGVGFIVTFRRGTEWAGTGKVTQKLPAVFPTANVVAYRTDIAAMDPNYKYGLNALSNPPAGRGMGAGGHGPR